MARSRTAVEVIVVYEPDLNRQVQALLAVLGVDTIPGYAEPTAPAHVAVDRSAMLRRSNAPPAGEASHNNQE